MEWGYAGSGPADFALNILYFFTHDRDFADAHHQAFKFKYVAGLPEEGGIIRGHTIRSWIADKRNNQRLALGQEYEEVALR
jgi:hypothetical protein